MAQLTEFKGITCYCLTDYDIYNLTAIPLVMINRDKLSYVVPSGYNLKLLGIRLSAYIEGIVTSWAMTSSLAKVIHRINDVDKLEYCLQWNGGVAQATISSQLEPSYGWLKSLLRLFNQQTFAENDTLKVVVTPIRNTPILWFIMLNGYNTTTNERISDLATAITYTTDANQLIYTYTVPSGGLTLLNWSVNAVSASSNFIGVANVKICGAHILQLRMLDVSGMGYQSIDGPDRICKFINLFGLVLPAGSTIDIDLTGVHGVGERITGTIFGELEPVPVVTLEKTAQDFPRGYVEKAKAKDLRSKIA